MSRISFFAGATGLLLLCWGSNPGAADAGPTEPAVFGLAFSVDSTDDTFDDVFPGDSQCDDGHGHCTLRAAIEECNAHSGDDGIFFNIPTTDPGYNAGTWTINLTKALPNLSTNIAINGPGADKLTVQPGMSGSYRIFNVTAAGTVSFSELTIRGGTAANAFGGGIYNNSTGTVNINNSTLSGNSAAEFGGGILNSGTLNVTNSTLGGNVAASQNFFPIGGGGIFNFGTLNVTNSTLGGNAAFVGSSSNAGGGAGIGSAAGTVNVTNCTLSGNTVFGPGGTGGAILTSGSGAMNVKSSLVALNSAAAGPDVAGPFTSGGFNLIGKTDGSTGFTAANDLTGTVASPLNPKLDPNGLQNNGGPTQTVALLFGSPAIDKGTSNGLTFTTDQRGSGFARTIDDPNVANAAGGDGTDIGAFEMQTLSPTPTPAPSKLANISTRSFVQTDDNVLIAGTIVVGQAPQKVIIRAIGPSLSNFGVQGALADPTLELHDGNGTLLEANDNWVDSPNKQAIIDSGVAPTNNLESAIVRTLPASANGVGYTAIVRGVNNTTGVAVVEVFALN